MKKHKIMITNDDGIQSVGLRAAVMAAKEFGDVIVVAPVTQQTAMGRAYPRTENAGIIQKVDYAMKNIEAYAVNGSPGYCAAFGLMEIMETPPDLVISGINFGCNMGLALTCSGTLGAAFEAREATKLWIGRVLEEVYEKKNEAYRFLNINIPAGDIDVKGYRMTFVENQNYYVLRRPPERDWSKPYCLSFSIDVDEEKLHRGSDIQTVCQDRLISVTPITMDMTRNTLSRF